MKDEKSFILLQETYRSLVNSITWNKVVFLTKLQYAIQPVHGHAKQTYGEASI